MYCPKCGKDNPDDASFCGSCSASLNGSAAPQGAAYGNNNAYAAAPQKSTGLGIVLSIIFVGLGHLYAGLISKGITLMIVYILLIVLSPFTIFLSLIVALILWIWSIYDVNKMINQYNQQIRTTGNPPW